MPPITANDFTTQVADYKYFVTNIVTNEVLAELPLTDVAFERALQGSGSFSGRIAITADTKKFELYANTMPGKTAIYAVRNGVCVWGGIIWARDYNIVDRSLSIEASEFTSYLHHRNIWKTYNYELEARAHKTTTGGKVRIEILTRPDLLIPATDTAGNRTKVYISFSEVAYIKHSGFYAVESDSPYAPSAGQFYVSIPELPRRESPNYYSGVTVSSRVDTYQYIRELLEEVFDDFSSVEFANELIEPGVKESISVTYRQISSEVATLTTATAHGLVVGQRVEIVNVHADIDGTWTITEIPSSTTLKFAVPGAANLSVNGSPISYADWPVKYRRPIDIDKRSVTKIQCTSNIVTVTTAVPHGFEEGDLIIASIDYKSGALNAGGQAQEVSTVPSSTTFTLAITTSNTSTNGVNVNNSSVQYSVPRRVLELETYSNHGYAVGNEIYVKGVDDPSWGVPMYDGYKKIKELPAADTLKRLQYDTAFAMTDEPNRQVTVSQKQHSGTTAVLYTSSEHDFFAGDTITVAGVGAPFDGNFTILSTPTRKQIKYRGAVSRAVSLQTAAGTITRTRTLVGGTPYLESTITFKKRVSSTATITVSSAHGLERGDIVYVDCNDTSFNNSGQEILITDVPTTTSFSYSSAGTGYATNTAATGFVHSTYSGFGEVYVPTHAASSGTTRTITITDHDFSIGEWICVNVTKQNSKKYNNGGAPVKITNISGNNLSYTYSGADSLSEGTTALPTTSRVRRAAYISKEATLYVRSYGEYPNNADLGGIEFSTTEYSQKAFINAPLRGGQLINVGEHLDKYANSPQGFEYRIDCSIEDVDGVGTFKRTFTLVPRTPLSLTEYLEANPLDPGEYAPPSAFGADLLTFEYPGNVSDVTLQENAENAVTRMFVTGDGGGAGSEGEARYSAASATDLLANDWPILDGVEKQEWPLVGYDKINVDNWNNYDVESDLNKSAERFLKESRPPMGEYSIVVNGSLDPVVGTYSPGDWCQIIINDDFIAERLNSELEPRNDVILRKVESIKVDVPNSPAFPEKITLNMIPEWEVDVSG